MLSEVGKLASMAEGYHRYFEVLPAFTEELRWQGLQVLFMHAEPVPARDIAHYGVPVVRVGQAVSHRGVRFPYVMQVDAVIAGLSDDVRAFYDSIYDKVLQDLHHATQ